MPNNTPTFARTTLGFMLAGAIALLVVVATSIWLAARTGAGVDEVVHTRDVRMVASNVYASLIDAETGQRGFLLTGEATYLEPYEAARKRLPEDIQRLRELPLADPELAPSIDRLRAMIDAKMTELAETVRLARAGQREAAIEMVRTSRGQIVMEEIRVILNTLLAKSEARVTRRLSDLDRGASVLTTTTIAGGALVALFAIGALLTIRRFTRDLVRARRQVEGLNASLEERIATRTVELSRANDEIQRFAYIVSHDLRAPLVNIMGFTSELEVGTEALRKYLAAGADNAAHLKAAQQAIDEEIPEALRFIRVSTAKMDRLINAILKLSREGRREIRPEAVDLARLLANATASIEHQVEAAGVRIELPERYPALTSDRLALEQVFGNLIDNAVKYLSPERPGVVTVRAHETAREVMITVSDNGRGIAEQDHERIFELFRRAGAQDQSGEGIGLAHVRALVRRLGGDITVRSRLGEGSTFQVNLPKVLPRSLVTT